MSPTHLNLLHELPEFREDIYELKITSGHFRRLLGEYLALLESVKSAEEEGGVTPNQIDHAARRRQAILEFELQEMLSNRKKTA